ncbi:unnamed protein product [Camellia sinensis]
MERETFPDDFKKYVDTELNWMPVKWAGTVVGGVYWSRGNDEPQRPRPTVRADINWELKKKIRDALYGILQNWLDYAILVQFWYQLMMISKFDVDLNGKSSEECLGLPGRVFKHQLLESTPNVECYSIKEYSQRDNALRCRVKQSLAFPVFEPSTQRCAGVLEVVTQTVRSTYSCLLWSYGKEIYEKFEDLTTDTIIAETKQSIMNTFKSMILTSFSSSSSSSSSDDESDDEYMVTLLGAYEKNNASMLQILKSRDSLKKIGGSVVGHKYIRRDRRQGHDRLFADYFAVNPVYSPTIFRRRFRMRRPLYLRILNAIQARNSYFVQKQDAAHVVGLSPLQKMTSAMRILSYGVAADAVENYIRIGESTAI